VSEGISFLSDVWFEIGLTWCSASECSIHPLAGYSMKEGAWFAGEGTRAVEIQSLTSLPPTEPSFA